MCCATFTCGVAPTKKLVSRARTPATRVSLNGTYWHQRARGKHSRRREFVFGFRRASSCALELLVMQETGHSVFFQRCQQLPALPAITSVASNYQRCQQLPALPAITSAASNYQRCQQLPALPAITSAASNYQRCQQFPAFAGCVTVDDCL